MGLEPRPSSTRVIMLTIAARRVGASGLGGPRGNRAWMRRGPFGDAFRCAARGLRAQSCTGGGPTLRRHDRLWLGRHFAKRLRDHSRRKYLSAQRQYMNSTNVTQVYDAKSRAADGILVVTAAKPRRGPHGRDVHNGAIGGWSSAAMASPAGAEPMTSGVDSRRRRQAGSSRWPRQ